MTVVCLPYFGIPFHLIPFLCQTIDEFSRTSLPGYIVLVCQLRVYAVT